MTIYILSKDKLSRYSIFLCPSFVCFSDLFSNRSFLGLHKTTQSSLLRANSVYPQPVTPLSTIQCFPLGIL